MRNRALTLSALCLLMVSLQAQKFQELARTPPMGWNSWNTFGVDINETLFKQMVDIIVESGMRDAGYEYIVVDDGWEAMERDTDGDLIADTEKFPSGMKSLADYVHSRGLKLGIHNCAGTKTCNGFPGGRGHEFQDARLYASWGIDYLKYDWCYHGTADSRETYTTMRDALYAAKRPVVYSICEWGDTKPWEWAKEVGHLWRTTGDITDCFNCQEVYSLGIKPILDLQAGLEKYAGPGHWNDPDMLEVGNPGLSLAESRAHFSLWCILAAPLMAGNDLRIMTPDILDILTNQEAISINQDPLGKQGYRFMDHPGKEIWVKELSTGDWGICFLNDSDIDVPLQITWDHFSFLQGEYEMRDIWGKTDLGTTNKPTEFILNSHDVVFLRLIKMP